MNRKADQNLTATMAVAGLLLAATTTGVFAAVCDSGAQEFVMMRTYDTAVSTTMSNQVLPGSTLSGGPSGGASDADIYKVTLSGEGDHSLAAGGFTVKAQMNINGGAHFDIDPRDSNTFHRGTAEAVHTMTWCYRAFATVSTGFRIYWSQFGGGTAYLDGYLISVERSN